MFAGSISDLQQRPGEQRYIADRGLAVSLFLAMRLGRPLFLKGETGVGKTKLAGSVAAALGTELIRLQCYDGLDVSQAVYAGADAAPLVPFAPSRSP
jgi:MoxR-like ATPase